MFILSLYAKDILTVSTGSVCKSQLAAIIIFYIVHSLLNETRISPHYSVMESTGAPECFYNLGTHLWRRIIVSLRADAQCF